MKPCMAVVLLSPMKSTNIRVLDVYHSLGFQCLNIPIMKTFIDVIQCTGDNA